MTEGELPEDWPQRADSKSVYTFLDAFHNTSVFNYRKQGAFTPCKFYLSSFNSQRYFVRAIRSNGGAVLQYKDVGKADVIIKPTVTQISQFSSYGIPICTPQYIIRSLQAGRMLDVNDYLLAWPRTDSDDQEDDDREEGELSQLENESKASKSRPKRPSGTQLDALESEASTVPYQPSSPSTSLRHQRTPQQQERRVTPGNSAIKDIRYLYNDDALDPDDRYVDGLLSSQSRSIEEFVSRATDSPGSLSSRSASISDNDFRIKTRLDSAAKGPHDMLNLSLAESPIGDSNHSSQLGSFGTPTQQQAAESTLQRMRAQTLGDSPPGFNPPSSPPRSNSSRSLFSRAKDALVHSAIGMLEYATPSRKRATLSTGISDLAIASQPVVLETQNSQASGASSDMDLENTPERSVSPEPNALLQPAAPETHTSRDFSDGSVEGLRSNMSRSASPELVMPTSQVAHLNQDFLFAQSPKNMQSPKPIRQEGLRATHGSPNAVIHLGLIDASDDEDLQPSLFLSSREHSFGSPKRASGSMLVSPEAKPTARNNGLSERPAPNTAISPEDKSAASPTRSAQWTGLGKRRRTAGRDSGYGHRPVPVVVANDSAEKQPLPEVPEQWEHLSQPLKPPASSKSQSLDSILATPTTMRARMRIVPFSPSKRIRMSTDQSPEVRTRANAAEVTVPAAISNSHPSDVHHTLPVLEQEMPTTESNVSPSHTSEEVVVPEPQSVPGLATESSASTIPTPRLDLVPSSDDDAEKPSEASSEPSKPPLVISGLFSNHDGDESRSVVESEPADSEPDSPLSASVAADTSVNSGNAADDVGDSDIPLSASAAAPAANVPQELSPAVSIELTSESAFVTPGLLQQPEVSQDVSKQACDDKEFWRAEDTKEPLRQSLGRTPQMASRSSDRKAATSNAYKPPARVRDGDAHSALEVVSKTQPRPSRSRQASSARRVTMCQRLLLLHKLGRSDEGLGLRLGDSLLNPPSFLGSSDLLGAVGRGQYDAAIPPSPARRARFSGAMRVFGESAPEISDYERMGYMRKLKGLIADTSLTPTQAMDILYQCTGDWGIARKYIVSGEASVPSEYLWTPEDDQVLQQGTDLDRMEELREHKGNVEVHRRLQFLNTFHS